VRVPTAAMRRLIAAWLVLGSSTLAFAGPGTIHLPTETDALPNLAQVETLLNGKRALETQLPGPVEDREQVDVSFDPSGRPIEIEVLQRLFLEGLGDYSFKVPGPALDVAAAPGSDAEPGLRRGAVLWQGFSPDRRELGAVLHLDPSQEVSRLPLAIHLEMTVDGEPLRGDVPASGRFSMALRIVNRSAVPISIPNAASDPVRSAAALDAVRRTLKAGNRPVPGEGGLPDSLPLVSQDGFHTTHIEAPFLIRGRLRFPPGSLENLHATGGTERSGGEGIIAFKRQLGEGRSWIREVRVTGVAHDLRLPDLAFQAVPAPPFAETLQPPGGGTWTEFAAQHPDAYTSRTMVRLLLESLWRTARLVQFDAYLGNPDATGESTTTYAFRLTPEPQADVVSLAVSPEVNPLGIGVLAVAFLLLLAGLAVAWARS
jgi:hypothetical protein